MERETGIEPAPSAWKAEVLPLNYSRVSGDLWRNPKAPLHQTVGGWRTPPHSDRVGGRWMTTGILPSAPPGPRRFRVAFRFAPGESVEPSHHLGGSRPPRETFCNAGSGGGRWIRTTEGVSQQIYSLPPLAAWVSLRISSRRRSTPSRAATGAQRKHATRPASLDVEAPLRHPCRTSPRTAQPDHDAPMAATRACSATPRVSAVCPTKTAHFRVAWPTSQPRTTNAWPVSP